MSTTTQNVPHKVKDMSLAEWGRQEIKLDEKVARLHLEKIGVELETLRKDQADYIGVTVE